MTILSSNVVSQVDESNDSKIPLYIVHSDLLIAIYRYL